VERQAQGRGVSDAPPAAARVTALALLGIALVFLSQYAWVGTTNFGGFDEWLLLWLNRNGLLSFPHANRPLQQIWTAPALLLSPCGFTGYHVLHGAYLILAGWLAYRLSRVVVGPSPLAAYLAGAFTVAWAPLDMMRLATVQACIYSATLAATLAALVLFVTSVERGSGLLLAAAAALAVVTVRSYEGGLLLLLAAPLLLRFAAGSSPSRRRATIVWEGALGAALAFVAWPLLLSRPDAAYQSRLLAADWNPARYLARLGLQFWLSLGPLASARAPDLRHPAVAISVAVFVLFGLLVLRAEQPPDASPTRRALARSGALGLLMAALGYALIVVSPQAAGATRTQILSAPGIAVALAAGIGLLASLVRGAWRGALILGLGSWVVGVGTAHTVGMQRAWDARSLYGAQVSSLRQLLREAPGIAPGTLVVLIDESGTWPMSFAFRHAVSLLYPDHVVGHVLGADQVFYALVARPDGLESVPWPVLRGPWRTEPLRFPYDRIVVYRLAADRALVRLEAWDDPRLPKLPEGARYDPAARITEGGVSVCARRLLGLPDD
jgi:hypothetical protein